MRYFYLDQVQGWRGPFSLPELRQMQREGVLLPGSPVRAETSDRIVLFKELFPDPQSVPGETSSSTPPSPPADSPFRSAPKDGFANRAGDDLKTLLPHLLLPFEELRTFRWVENRTTLSVAAVGLLPLAIYALFRGPEQVGNAYWAMAMYFSVLWAMFFYKVLDVKEARPGIASLCFFGTGLVSISVLLVLYRIWPLKPLYQWTVQNHGFLMQWFGYIFSVGLPEELCKALVLFAVVHRFAPLSPRTMMFYGLMSGLGFGIYEGVKYQSIHNFKYAWDTARQNPDNLAVARAMAEYYLLNLIRLTTLPFLHAIWSGIAGYFIGFAEQHPGRKRGLLIVAIGLPTLLHGSYNAFGGSVVAILIALASVVALTLYYAKSVDFEKLLAQRHTE